jgi:hypothetical protein
MKRNAIIGGAAGLAILVGLAVGIAARQPPEWEAVKMTPVVELKPRGEQLPNGLWRLTADATVPNNGLAFVWHLKAYTSTDGVQHIDYEWVSEPTQPGPAGPNGRRPMRWRDSLNLERGVHMVAVRLFGVRPDGTPEPLCEALQTIPAEVR